MRFSLGNRKARRVKAGRFGRRAGRPYPAAAARATTGGASDGGQDGFPPGASGRLFYAPWSPWAKAGIPELQEEEGSDKNLD